MNHKPADSTPAPAYQAKCSEIRLIRSVVYKLLGRLASVAFAVDQMKILIAVHGIN